MTLEKRTINAGKWSAVSAVGLVFLQLSQVYILSRLLTADDFGLYALVMIVIQVVCQFSNMGIGSAVIQRQDATDDELSSLYWLNVIFGCSFALLILAVAYPVALFFDDLRLFPLLLWASMGVAVPAVGQQFQYLLQKALEFRSLAIVELFSSSLGVAASIYFAMIGHGVFAFVYGMLVNQSLRAVLLLWAGLRLHRPSLHFSFADLKGYLRFGAFLSAQNIVNILTARVDSIIIGRLLGPSALGVYFFAQQFTSQVFIRIIPIVSRVAFPVFSKLQNDPARMEEGYLRMVQALAIIIFPILVGLGLVVDELLEVFFVPEWSSAAGIIQIMVFVMMFKTVIAPIGTVLLARARTDVGFYMNVYMLIQLPLFVVFGAAFGIMGVAWSLLCSTVISFIVWLVVQSRVVSIDVIKMCRLLILPAAGVFLMALSVFGVRSIMLANNFNGGVALFAYIVSGAVTYLLIIWRYRPEWLNVFLINLLDRKVLCQDS